MTTSAVHAASGSIGAATMIGTTLGPYRIESEIGSGGMGRVFLAVTEDGARRALKIVHPQLLQTPGFFKRFLREAEMGRKVDHGNVVRTLDADAISADGEHHHFLVTEYVEGKNLRELLGDLDTVPESLVREIALQAARGLAAIHAEGIVHRDLKPENILITDDHDVRIMDLGVAKLQEASLALTMEGQFAGTMLYAAPEQFESNQAVEGSDLYALGILLYELATGRHPFPYADPGALIQAHLSELPAPASARNEDLSAFFSEVLATLLAKDPAERFGSADAFAQVLEEGEASAWWAARAAELDDRHARTPRTHVSRETGLWGRDDALQALRDAWGNARRGRGGIVFVEGEAGIGKTRLVDAFLREMSGDEHVLYGSYTPSGGAGGLSEAILSRFGKTQLAEALSPYMAVTAALVPAYAALLKRESRPAGAERLSADALQSMSVHLMRGLAAEKPLVWVVDDLHFASEDGKNLVLALARAIAGHKAMLIVTSRPGTDLSSFSRLENFERHRIGRLSPREVVQLLEEALGSPTIADQLGVKIARKSDGVPFFIFEMIRDLKERGFIRRKDDGSYEQAQRVTEIEVPTAVKDLIHHRLGELDEEHRAILDAGAVQGLSFDAGLIAEVLDMKRVVVLRALAEIERRSGLVRGEANGCRFDQNQVQEVLYADLMPSLKAEYHTLIAESITKRHGEKPQGEALVVLADHQLRGRRPGEALPLMQGAFEHFGDSYRNERAFEMATLALERAEPDDEQRAELLTRMGSVLDLMGRRDDAGKAFREALLLADRIGDPAMQSRVRRSLGYMMTETGQAGDTRQLLEDAVRYAREAEDLELEAIATGALGGLAHRSDSYDDSLKHYTRYRDLARQLNLVRDESIATCNIGLTLWSMAKYDEAIAALNRAQKLAERCGNRRGASVIASNLGIVYVDQGRFEDAQKQQEEARRIAREVGYRYTECLAVGNLGTVLLGMGKIADAQSQYRQHVDLSKEIGDRSGEAIAWVNLALVDEAVGRYDRCLEHAQKSLSIAEEFGEKSIIGYAKASIGAAQEFTGDIEGAAKTFAETAATHKEIGHTKTAADVLNMLARCEVKLGRTDDAIAHYEEAAQLARDLKVPGTEVLALSRRALLDGGNTETALEVLAAHDPLIPLATKMEVYFNAWEAIRDPWHLEQAHAILQRFFANAPEEDRDSMRENVAFHREILDAAAEHL